MLNTGFGALWPSPHRLVWATMPDSCSSWRRPSRVARPSQIPLSSMNSWVVPTRHGMHLPQDSSRQKSMKYRATSTMQEVSSITIIPPDPMMEPTRLSDS